MYSVHLARNTGCLSLIPCEMIGMADIEKGRRDKMHLYADSAITLMVTTRRGNNAVIKSTDKDSNESSSLVANEVINSQTSLQYMDLLSSN